MTCPSLSYLATLWISTDFGYGIRGIRQRLRALSFSSNSSTELPLTLTRVSRCKPDTLSWEQQNKIPRNRSEQQTLTMGPPAAPAALLFKLYGAQLGLLRILLQVSPAESNQRCKTANRCFTVSVNSEAQQLLPLKEERLMSICLGHGVSDCWNSRVEIGLFCFSRAN